MAIGEGQCAAAFFRVAELAQVLGVSKINELPGCWEVKVDELWQLALNGHGETILDSSGLEVPAYHFVLTFNGWPAGLCSPAGGIIAAGAAANEDTFIAAVEARIRLEGGVVKEIP